MILSPAESGKMLDVVQNYLWIQSNTFNNNGEKIGTGKYGIVITFGTIKKISLYILIENPDSDSNQRLNIPTNEYI